jgi:hypothetical protein
MKREIVDITTMDEDNDDEGRDEILTLNIGGRTLQTLKSTLTSFYPESLLSVMFRKKNLRTLRLDSNGNIFIDTDYTIFSCILQYLRRGISFDIIPSNIDEYQWEKELDYWALKPLVIDDKVNTTSFVSLMEKSIEEAVDHVNEALTVAMTLTNGNQQVSNGYRTVYTHIPLNKNAYTLSCGMDIGDYLNTSAIQSTIDSIYGSCSGKRFLVKLSGHSRAQSAKDIYTFNGITYNTVNDATLTITFIVNK